VSTALPGPGRSLAALLVTDDRLARATWSRLAEPADQAAVDLVARYGAGPALEVVLGRADAAHERFRSRLPALDPRPALDLVHRLGGRLVCPDDAEWPRRFLDLPAPPFCLWVRGPLDLGAACERSVAVVGSRAATAYGQDVAHEIADGVAERGFTVVSGGALGIDGFAHAAALRAAGRTVAVLAGGIDRPYPRAHEDLIAEVAEVGAVVSEVPPGSAPTRGRFIQRNRMIATMSAGTVVVEAAVRSGALNTARTALSHQRPVGAVPGPVTSLVSAGCHQLLREGQAVLVCDAAQVAEHVGPIGEHLAPVPSGPARADWDELEPDERRVLEALPRSRGSSPEKLAAVAGLEPAVVRSVLGRLALRDLARRDTAGWRRGALRGGPG
jgi:DNA processing protein